MGVSAVRPSRRSRIARFVRLPNLGISARSAAVSAIVVFFALAFAGGGFVAILYQSLLQGVDDATAGRVRHIAEALQSNSPDNLDSALLTTNQRVVAIQLIAPDGKVIVRSGSAPTTPLVPVTEFDLNLRAACPTTPCPMTTCGSADNGSTLPSGEYTVLVGGGSEAVEATARTVALLLAAAPRSSSRWRRRRPTGSFAAH